MGKKQTVNPINLLRDFIMNGKKIKQKENYLYFENQKLSLKTETAWLSKKTDKRYDLGSLWLFYVSQEQKMNTAQYLQKKNELKLQMVSNPDQEEILNYLQGKISYSEDIDLNLENKGLLDSRGEDRRDNQEVVKKVKREVDENDLEADNLRQIELLYRIERPIQSKNKALRKTNKNFSNIIEYINILKEEKNNNNNNIKQTGGQGQIASQQQQQQKQQCKSSFLDEILLLDQHEPGSNKPIIIVPLAFQSGNICVTNATSFLLHGKYVDIHHATPPNNHHTFVKNIQSRQAVFEIRSDEKVFEPHNWKRVVAAFITGSNNEFRKWPNGDQPAILFNKIKGFYIKYHDVPVPEHVKKYNVKQLVINRNKRHLDVYQKNIFWQELEQFIIRPRPSLQ